MNYPAGLISFCRARIEEERTRAERMEHFTVYEQPYYSCAGSRAEPYGDLEWGDEHCDCHLAVRKAKRLREIGALRSIVAGCDAALCYPANVPMANRARSVLADIASIWEDHPGYAAVQQC